VLGAYDRTRPLVVDPAFDYATYLGGARNDRAWRVAVDADGSAYIVGTTNSPAFPPAGAPVVSGGGPGPSSSVAFLAKLNPGGGVVGYLSYWGSAYDQPFDVAVDVNRQVFVAGLTAYPGTPPLPGGFQTTPWNNGNSDGYLLRFNDLGALTYGTYVAGIGDDVAYGVDTDGQGNAWVVGSTNSAGVPAGQYWSANTGRFPIRGLTYQTTHPGGRYEGFVVRINTNKVGDQSLELGTFVGGYPVHGIQAVQVDNAGNVYAAGTAYGIGNEFGVGNGYRTAAQGFDAFLAKLDPALQTMLYSTYIGGSTHENDSSDEGFSLGIDESGHAWVAGGTKSTDFYTTPDALKREVSGALPGYPARDGFLVRIDTTRTGMASLVYSTLFGGDGDEYVHDLAVDSGGNAYIVGHVASKSSPHTSRRRSARFSRCRTPTGLTASCCAWGPPVRRCPTRRSSAAREETTRSASRSTRPAMPSSPERPCLPCFRRLPAHFRRPGRDSPRATGSSRKSIPAAWMPRLMCRSLTAARRTR